MTAPTQDLIDRLGAAALDARTAVREAHEATKDLRGAMREARELMARLAEEEIEGRFGAVLHAEMDKLTKATEEARDAVFRRFDRLVDKLLRAGRPDGLEELADQAEAVGAVVIDDPAVVLGEGDPSSCSPTRHAFSAIPGDPSGAAVGRMFDARNRGWR